MKTAKELFDEMLDKDVVCTSTEMMIEFAKMHVKEALKQASENAEIETKYYIGAYEVVDKESILISYPLDNIK